VRLWSAHPGEGLLGRPSYPLNGNFVAFSLDHGESWSHVVELTSGVMTTHYMGLREVRDGELAVVYDAGAWNRPGRMALCRSLLVEV